MLKITTPEKCTPLNIDDFYIKHVISGLDELVFNISLEDENYSQIVEEAMVEYEQPYLIKAIDAGSKSAKVKCQLNLDELKQTLNPTYTNDSDTLSNTVESVLPTGWIYRDHTNIDIRRTIEGIYTPYDVLVQCMTVYDVVMRFDVANKKIDIYRLKDFEPIGAFASRQLNLKQIDYKGKSSNFCTRLYAYGKDGLSFADINNGKPYVESFTYSNKVICGSWIDERYEDSESLLADAQAKVDAAAVPESSYTCAVYDLAAVEPEIYGFQDFSLFSVIRLIDDNKKIMVNHQVVEYCRYPFYPEKNVVTLSATAPKLSNVVKDMQSSVSNLKNEIVATETHMEKEIKNATELITGNKGGNVVVSLDSEGNPYEILIMDTKDIATAKNVWRWNASGWGYSKNGYNGPFKLAATLDGGFLADFITAGILNANLIRAGIIQDLTGKSWWNLDTGEMHTSGTFSQETPEGIKSVEIKDNQIDFYAWHDNGNYAGSIGAVRHSDEEEGISVWCDENEYLTFGPIITEEDGKKRIYPVIQISGKGYDEKTPYMRNTATGTLFPNNPDGGIVIEHGLVKNWGLSRVADSVLSVITGMSWSNGNITSVTFADIQIKDGLIYTWTNRTENY